MISQNGAAFFFLVKGEYKVIKNHLEIVKDGHWFMDETVIHIKLSLVN